MKIAVAVVGDEVSPHFGHAPVFAIFSVDAGKMEREDIPSPGHEPGRLPALMCSMGITYVIAGGIGPRAVDHFCDAGIEVIMGVSGEVESAVAAFLDGTLEVGESMCHHPRE